MERVCYKKNIFKIEHVWYYDNLQDDIESNADILYIHNTDIDKKLINSHTIINEQFTLYTDLDENIEDLFKKLNGSTKRKINKCTKEKIKYDYYTSNDLYQNSNILKLLKNSYENMYKSKGMNKKFNMNLIKSYIDENILSMITASKDNKILVYHVYILNKENARSLYSCSEFRTDTEYKNLIGRANVFLHWMDICHFKDMGIKRYDWGGISSFKNPNGIDRFKMHFRGREVTYYNIIIANTLKGKLAIKGLKIKQAIERLKIKFSKDKSKYIFRLDDICENMNWNNFNRIKEIFISNDIKPIIGVIPNNNDKELLKYPKAEINLWEEIKELQKIHGWTIAMHGYTHVYETNDSGILGINKRSEFSGLSKEQQNLKIKSAMDIFKSDDVNINMFMAPSHSFDNITIECLKENNINAITDGYALYPYYDKDMYFLPQLFSKPRNMPFGVYTWCLHPNSLSEEDINDMEEFIKNNKENIICFKDSYNYMKTSGVYTIQRILLKKIINFIRLLRRKIFNIQ